MKKEDFMTIMRSKAKEPLTAEQESAFGAIGEAIEKAFTEDSIEGNASLMKPCLNWVTLKRARV